MKLFMSHAWCLCCMFLFLSCYLFCMAGKSKSSFLSPFHLRTRPRDQAFSAWDKSRIKPLQGKHIITRSTATHSRCTLAEFKVHFYLFRTAATYLCSNASFLCKICRFLSVQHLSLTSISHLDLPPVWEWDAFSYRRCILVFFWHFKALMCSISWWQIQWQQISLMSVFQALFLILVPD